MGASTDGLLSEDGGRVETPSEEIDVSIASFGWGLVSGLDPLVWDLREHFG